MVLTEVPELLGTLLVEPLTADLVVLEFKGCPEDVLVFDVTLDLSLVLPVVLLLLLGCLLLVAVAAPDVTPKVVVVLGEVFVEFDPEVALET